MATYTTNYNLKKPDSTDPIGDFRQDYNDNLDIIDANLGGGGGSGNVDDVMVNGVSVVDGNKVAQITSYKEVTQAEYDALPATKLTDGIAYFIKDGGGSGGGDSVAWTQIQQSGTKIAEIEINGVTTDVYAPQGAPPFSALIIVTADTGKTVTATKGGDTYTATEVSTGQYEVSVDSIGTWTISDGILSDTVTVTAQTTYYVTLSAIPDGSTVLPTDDVQILLNCADIWDKAYTTIAQLLADTTSLMTVISDNNAIDYLVRSTTFASSVTADSSAMTYIGLNNYASNTLLADSTWGNAICNSAYFESVLNTKNPNMTSNTVPSGVASANGNYTDYYPWKALDGNDNTAWASPSTASLSDWLKYEFADDGIVVKRLRIYSNRYQTYKIQASNDNANWTDLYSGSVGDVTTYINNDTRYKYLKFTPTSLMGGANSGVVYTFKVYGREDL